VLDASIMFLVVHLSTFLSDLLWVAMAKITIATGIENFTACGRIYICLCVWKIAQETIKTG